MSRAGCPSVWRLGFLSEVSRQQDRAKPRSSNKPFSWISESRSRLGRRNKRSVERKGSDPGTATSRRSDAKPSERTPKDRLRHRSVLPAARFLKVSPTETDARFRANRRRLSDSGEACLQRPIENGMHRPKYRHGQRRRRSEAGIHQEQRALSIQNVLFMEQTGLPLRSSRDNRSTSIRTALRL